jgi:segregation and condensation protein B
VSSEEKKRIIEALIFAGADPLTVKQVKDVFDDKADVEEIRSLIAELKEEYDRENRSFQITGIAGGFQMTTRPEYAGWVKKLFASGQSNRLSRPALETLAIIAYRQPATRQEIEFIRGVNVDGVVAGLLEKKLIRVAGRKETVGRPMMYGTTNEFLEYFGLHSLDELPRLEEFADSGTDITGEGGGIFEKSGHRAGEPADTGTRVPAEEDGKRVPPAEMQAAGKVEEAGTGEVSIDGQSQEVAQGD